MGRPKTDIRVDDVYAGLCGYRRVVAVFHGHVKYDNGRRSGLCRWHTFVSRLRETRAQRDYRRDDR